MGSHPDSDIHPVATGEASMLVKKHQEEELVKLYAGWFCPFVQRVWLVLEEKKIPYQYIEVNPYHKPQSLLDLNPRGLVPTLSYPAGPNGELKPLYESNIVMEFLEESFPDHTPHLFPRDNAYEKARMKIWMDFVTSRIIPAFHRFLQGKGETMEKAREEFLGYLKEWTKAMDPEGPYFGGWEVSMPDLVLAPWATRLWVFDHFKEGGLGMPEGAADDVVWKRWNVWVKAMEERRSVRETSSENEYFLPIYKRYADDTAMSELAKATRAGKGVP